MGVSDHFREVRRLPSFAAVGCAGFIVDGGLLMILVTARLCGPLEARILSLPIAIFVTWTLNRRFTFRSESALAPSLRTYGRYCLIQAAGAALNFLVYCVLVVAFPRLIQIPLIPLGMAAVVAMIVNFWLSQLLVFRDK